MSSLATSSPVSASTFRYLIRWPVFLLIWLKLILSASDVAGYSATGQVTSESRKKPFQFARGAMDADSPGNAGDGGKGFKTIMYACSYVAPALPAFKLDDPYCIVPELMACGFTHCEQKKNTARD